MNNLTDVDYETAANFLGCSIAAVKAFALVESAGDGFLPNREPKILFEAHHFSRLTKGAFDKSHPGISSPSWNPTLYKGGQKEHERLAEAIKLDRDAALASASWGKFQIMGFNWKMMGYVSLQAFVNDMYKGEYGQLQGFIRFIKASKLDKPLRELDWKALAKGYNGPGYKKNNYDVKLMNAYKGYA